VRRRRSHVGRAIGVDAEPYRGRLVQDRGPRVGLVGHSGRGHRARHLVRDSLVEHRHSLVDGRLTDMGKPGTPEWKRATVSHDYRRGFTAGVVVTASAASVLMIVGFVSMGGMDALGDRLERAAGQGSSDELDEDAPVEEHTRPFEFDGPTGADHGGPGGPHTAAAAGVTGATGARTTGVAPGADVPKETKEQRLLREEGELAHEELGGRDLGLDELVRAQQHNRKVLKRGNSMFDKVLGRDDDSAE